MLVIITNLYGCMVFNMFVVPFVVDSSFIVLPVSCCSLPDVVSKDCVTLVDAVFLALKSVDCPPSRVPSSVVYTVLSPADVEIAKLSPSPS